MFDLIFLTLFLTAWLACGFAPWLVVSVWTRGRAGLAMLPLCLFAALVTGLAVPLILNDGWPGMWLSWLLAMLVPSALLATRRFARFNPHQARQAAAATLPAGKGDSTR